MDTDNTDRYIHIINELLEKLDLLLDANLRVNAQLEQLEKQVKGPQCLR